MGEWYYIKPGPFRIKIPLHLICNNLDDNDYEFDFLTVLQKEILHYIFYDYGKTDKGFESLLEGMDIDEIYQQLKKPCEKGLIQKYDTGVYFRRPHF